MTWYSPYNTYSNQFQYYHSHPYSYSSYQSTPYGMMTDASFQNRYYAVDGITTGKALKTGLKALLQFVKIGLSIGGLAIGGDLPML